LAIWDTAGQHRFRTLTSTYYRGAQGIILVYDITRRDTFDNVQKWSQEADLFTTKENIVKVLVGNKLDLETSRRVSRQEGSDFAYHNEMLFFEASAKTSDGVQDAFAELVEKILDSPSLLEGTNTDKNVIKNNHNNKKKNKNGRKFSKNCGCNII